MEINEKIRTLRKYMLDENIDTYIITKQDPHQSEYSPLHWNQVKFISGFTGSNGVVVITKDTAGLWTDGRYYIQAQNEINGSSFILHKASEPSILDHIDFSVNITPQNGTIAFDGRTISAEQGERLATKARRKNISIKTDKDYIGLFWMDRPALSDNLIFDHLVKYCGKTRNEKLSTLREEMKKENITVYILSSTDDIAWLFNLRGNDMPCIPFFASYAVIDMKSAALFVHMEKAKNVKEILCNEEVILRDYDQIYEYIKSYDEKNIFALNPIKTSYNLYSYVKDFQPEKTIPDITTKLKAVKNQTELENLEKVNIRDGVAMVKYIMWLEVAVKTKNTDEYQAGEKINEIRGTLKNFVEPSFPTIAGYNENAAMMHYSAKKDGCANISPSGMLLLDSGGSFYDGTTDITRTFILGNMTEEMKTDFTLVLKSHISLARHPFLYGATGSNLDVLARMPMWEKGLDYKCGTGHGVGFFLNIHEGPHSFSQVPNTAKLEPGMIITNEPGVYKANKYGIRIENTMKVIEYKETDCGRFLCFEIISYCPIDAKGISHQMLTYEEKTWLNDYHKTVYDKLSPHLNKDEQEWLKNAAAKI